MLVTIVNSRVGIPDHGWTLIDRTHPATFARWRGTIGALGTAPAGAARSAAGFSDVPGCRRWGVPRAGVPRTPNGIMVALPWSNPPTAPTATPAWLIGASLVVSGVTSFRLPVMSLPSICRYAVGPRQSTCPERD